MILTGYAGELGIRSLVYGEDGELLFGTKAAAMPYLRMFMDRALHGATAHERGVAGHIGKLGLWRRFDWEPEAAEAILRYIAHGSFAEREGTKRAVESELLRGVVDQITQLLGPDGKPV